MDYPKSVPGVGLVDGKFVNEDPVLGRQGSLIPAQWGNQVTAELLAVISAAELTPDEGEDDQLLQAIQALQTGLSADSGMVVISTAGVTNWVVPEVLRSGKKKARVTVCGAGGASGAVAATSATQSSFSSPGNGGAEGVSLLDLVGVISVPVTIGTGGTSTVGNNGASGGASSFGSYISAPGGSGGDAGFPFSEYPTFRFPDNQNSTVSGAAVSSGPKIGVAAIGLSRDTFNGGQGGAGIFGGGFGIRSINASVAAPATPGAGGGSSQNNPSNAARAGNPGARGIVIIEW